MRNEDLAITVVVPTYNASHYITFCIDSILSQTFQDFELIIMDDASEDDTYEICQRIYGQLERVTLLRNPVNKGQWYARNMAITKGRGKYVYFMDDDDELLPWALEELYKTAEAEQADVVHANLWYSVYTDSRMIARDTLWKKFRCEECVAGRLQETDPIGKILYQAARSEPMPWLNLYRREFLAVEGIKFPEMTFAEDNSFAIEVCLKAKRFFCINVSLYLYRCYANKKVRMLRRLPKAFPYMLIMLGEFNRIFGAYSEKEISPEFRKDMISKLLLSQINFYVYQIMNAGGDEDFARIKQNLELICHEGAEFSAYLIYMLEDAWKLSDKIRHERDEKVECAQRFFADLAAGRSKFAHDYRYIYCQSKEAVYIEGAEGIFYCQSYEWLGDAALELGRYQEAMAAYDKAASFAGTGSERAGQIMAKSRMASRYFDEEWEQMAKQYAPGPRSYVIRQEQEGANDVQETGGMTLGTVLQYKQINDGIIAMWREIMAKLPSTSLLVKAEEFAEEAMLVEAGERFAAAGMDLKRVRCQKLGANLAEEYSGIDIFLGTYPVQEAERLLEALYMGVPAIVLEGMSNDARLCGNVLRKVGLSGLVARNREEYMGKVIEMAHNQDSRKAMREEIIKKLSRFIEE